MRTKVDKQISSFKVRIDYSKKFPVQDVPTPPHYQKNFLCRFGWFRTMKKNNKFGVGLRPSTYLGCRKPTPFFFFIETFPSFLDKHFYPVIMMFEPNGHNMVCYLLLQYYLNYLRVFISYIHYLKGKSWVLNTPSIIWISCCWVF